jgi:hypothetical protein
VNLWRQTRPPPQQVTARCEECGVEMVPDSSRLRLQITCDDELLTYCEACWESEFADD